MKKPMHSYEEFVKGVKSDLVKSLARFGASEQRVDEYMKEEEGQIRGAFRGYQEDDPNDERSDDARFTSAVTTIAQCLEMCY